MQAGASGTHGGTMTREPMRVRATDQLLRPGTRCSSGLSAGAVEIDQLNRPEAPGREHCPSGRDGQNVRAADRVVERKREAGGQPTIPRAAGRARRYGGTGPHDEQMPGRSEQSGSWAGSPSRRAAIDCLAPGLRWTRRMKRQRGFTRRFRLWRRAMQREEGQCHPTEQSNVATFVR